MHSHSRSGLARILRGHLRPHEVRWYVALEAAIFWGLIALAWFLFPAEHHYSIWTHTFSFLGSFEEKHNPSWWWIFSIAMIFWGLANIPLNAYVHRRLRHVSPYGAWAVTLLFLLGSIGVILVALFPDAPAPVFGSLRWTEIHEKAAVMVFLGFGLGIFWLGALLALNRIRRSRGTDTPLRHRRFLPPYLLWLSVFGTAVYFQASWEIMYAQRKAAAQAAGTHIGSSWSESLNTIYGFPFWENLVIYAMYIFLAWLPLALPAEMAARTPPRRN